MDLLGRLASEPLSASSTTTTQNAAVTPEFQRALNAQVQRGVEQAAAQAAASGAWAGADAAGSGSVMLRLHPANLGMLRVYLRMDGASSGGSGGVKARFEVSSSRAKGILGSSIESLRTALQERGLTVDEVTVTDMPLMPERGFGLPPLAETARDAGAAFAENDRGGASDPDASRTGGRAGGARAWSSAESGGVPMNESGWEGGGHPVMLAALSPADSALTIGTDGRVYVDALV